MGVSFSPLGTRPLKFQILEESDKSTDLEFGSVRRRRIGQQGQEVTFLKKDTSKAKRKGMGQAPFQKAKASFRTRRHRLQPLLA